MLAPHPSPEIQVRPVRAGWAPAPLQLGVVLAVACAQRVLCWSALYSLPLFRLPDADAGIYHAWAQRMAGGDYALGHEVLRMSPGYFYLLGAIYAVLGDGVWAFRVVQALLGLVLVALCWDSARRLWGLHWALCTGLVAALYGPLPFFESVQLADAPGAVLHGLVLWQAICMLERSARGASIGLGAFVALGMAFGLCSAIRPNALLLSLPLAWAIWKVTGIHDTPRGAAAALRGRVKPLLVFALAAACAIAPITLRNYFAAGEPVLLTAHGGLNVYLGNGPAATGSFRVPAEVADARGPAEQFSAFHAAAERAVGHRLSARGADAHWFGASLEHVRRHPLEWLRLMLKKLRLYWNGREIWDVYHYDFYRALDPRLRFSLPYSAMAALSLLGTLYACARTRASERFLGLFNLSVCAAIVLVLIAARYRLAMFAGAVLACTYALRVLARAARARDRAAVRAGVLLLAALWITWPVPPKRSIADEEFWKLGAGYLELGQLQPAEAAFVRSLQLNPDHDGSHHELARLYERTGQHARAAAHWTWLLHWAERVGEPQVENEARAHLSR
jgi:tetratricopeptide (TPR) repeat protein